MSMSSPVAGQAGQVAESQELRDWLLAGLAVAASLFILYAVFLDQGALLYPVLGKLSWTANYLHEFAHDGRHLLGAPCH